MSTSISRKRTAEDYESDDGFVEDGAPSSKPGKKAKNSFTFTPSAGPQKDDNGDEFWEISGKRRLTLSTYRSATYVNIREYYEKDGKALPGKKGISLSMEQYAAIIQLMPEIETILEAKGEKVPRPKYEGGKTVTERADEDEDGGGEGKEEVMKSKKSRKGNFEETSEEEEDD